MCSRVTLLPPLAHHATHPLTMPLTRSALACRYPNTFSLHSSSLPFLFLSLPPSPPPSLSSSLSFSLSLSACARVRACVYILHARSTQYSAGGRRFISRALCLIYTDQDTQKEHTRELGLQFRHDLVRVLPASACIPHVLDDLRSHTVEVMRRCRQDRCADPNVPSPRKPPSSRWEESSWRTR